MSEGKRHEVKGSEAAPHRDAFVGKIAGDPKSFQGASIIGGFVGESTEEGMTRLYQEESLTTYIDVSNGDILASEKLESDKPAASMALTRVWVSPDAKVKHGRTDMSQFGGMLSGPLTAQLGGAAAAIPIRSLLYACVSWYHACNFTHQHCVTLYHCQISQYVFCTPPGGSAVDACPSALGCTIGWQETPVIQQTPVLQQQTPQFQGFAAQPQMRAMAGQAQHVMGGQAALPHFQTILINQCLPPSVFPHACPTRGHITLCGQSCLIINCFGTQHLVLCSVICTIGSPGCPIPVTHPGTDPGPQYGGGGFMG